VELTPLLLTFGNLLKAKTVFKKTDKNARHFSNDISLKQIGFPNTLGSTTIQF